MSLSQPSGEDRRRPVFISSLFFHIERRRRKGDGAAAPEKCVMHKLMVLLPPNKSEFTERWLRIFFNSFVLFLVCSNR